MELHSSCFIHENKKNIIQSKFLITTNTNNKSFTEPIIIINQNKQNNQYSLNQCFFDPSESSPPNNFLTKLNTRMQKYQKNVINLLNEY
jgi:hypothetical protein